MNLSHDMQLGESSFPSIKPKPKWYEEEGEKEELEKLPELEIKPLTKSANINEIYAMGMAVREGRCELSVFKSRLISEMRRFFEIYKNFLHLYIQTPLPGEKGRRSKEVFTSMEKYQKSLERISEYTENPDDVDMEEGLNRAVEAINELTRAYDEFSESQSAEKTKRCRSCNHPNPLGTVSCNSCNTVFFLGPEEIPMEFSNLSWKIKKTGLTLGAVSFPESLTEVYENYGKVAGGEVSKEKYLETLDWYITQFELCRQKLERQMYTASQELLQSSHVLFDGLDKAKRTLEKLRDKLAFDQTDNLGNEWNNLLIAIHTIARSQQ
jgi:hypothetical protein